MESFNASRLFAAGVIAAVIAGSAAAANVDFEPTGGRTPTETPFGDDARIATDAAFLVGGTSVYFGWETTGDLLADASMRIEDYNDGLAETAGVYGGVHFGYSGLEQGLDRDLSGTGDNYFMRVSREDGHTMYSGSMLMTFATGVSSVSGSLLDLDYNERYRLTAYDALGNVIASSDTILASPSEGLGSLNCDAYNFVIDAGGQEISFLRISFIGINMSPLGGGWGFDNIGVVSVPAPGAIALLGLAGLVGRRRR